MKDQRTSGTKTTHKCIVNGSILGCQSICDLQRNDGLIVQAIQFFLPDFADFIPFQIEIFKDFRRNDGFFRMNALIAIPCRCIHTIVSIILGAAV